MAARYKDYYQVMGLERSASAEDIKRAYRRLARKFHPDVSKEPRAEERFKELGEAYEVLKDPEKRAAYDQLGAHWRPGDDFTPPPDWSNDVRGTRSSTDRVFSDFFDSLFGGIHRGGAKGPRRGEDQSARIDLTIEEAFRGVTRSLELAVPQFSPDGSAVVARRTLQVKIPAGVLPGQHIRLAGQGAPAPSGGPAGDLFLEIQLAPHPYFA
ncbi:MAG: DnaJ domain-containing protein, partial [Acidiferrobacteraceae bacterium]